MKLIEVICFRFGLFEVAYFEVFNSVVGVFLVVTPYRALYMTYDEVSEKHFVVIFKFDLGKAAKEHFMRLEVFWCFLKDLGGDCS